MKLTPKILLVNLPVIIIFIIVSAIIAYSATKSSLENEIGTHQLEITRQAMDKVDWFLAERLVDIQGFAEHGQFKSFLTGNMRDPAAANKSLSATRDLSNTWSDVSIIDLKGTLRASTTTANIGQDLNSLDPTLTGLYQKALTGQAVSSDAFTDSRNHAAIIYMSPVYTGQKVTGVIMGQISWPAMIEILQGIKGATANLLNRDGKVIISNKPGVEILKLDYSQTDGFKRIKASQDESSLLPGLDDSKEENLVSYVREPGYRDYSGNGWFLVVSTPTKVAFAPARELGITLVSMRIVSISLVIVLVLFFINRQVIRPLAGLSAAVNRVSLGDLSQAVPVKSNDEIGRLSQNFNEMTHQLAVTQRHLEAAKQQADEGRAQLESSINGLRQGFILTNDKGQVVMANAAAQDILQSGPGKHARPLNKKAFSLATLAALLPADLKLTEAVQHTLNSRQLAKFPALPLGGRFLNVYLSPVISENTAIGCVLLLEDVTEERIIQRSRDEFFSIASHELRTPLTAIRGNTSLMQQYFPEVLKDPNLSEMVSDIHDSAVRLIEIVNDFLDVSRLEQDKMKFNPVVFPIERIIEKITYEMAGVSRDKEIFLNFDQHTLGKIPAVYADPDRVKQVLYNLVGNAMKFTEKGGVTINCLHEGNFLKVCVTDTGTGISEEGQQILFHKFQQTGENILTRDNTRGTGLGLYISKLLTEHMGGETRLEHTELGKGSTFSFTVPLATKAQASQAKLASNKPSSVVNENV